MLTRITRVAVSIAISAGVVVALSAPAFAARPLPLPRTVTLDSTQLLLTKVRYQLRDPEIVASMRTLLGQADAYLTAGPWTIATKTQLPPSGDPHDYLSEAPYWWPTQPKTADNPWGCPYIQRDGVRNPAVDDIADHAVRGSAFDAIYRLSLAWYYTGNRAYAERAHLDLRTWFLDAATRMNPNMNYTQFIPCVVDGRGTGIIEFSEALPDVVDAVAILDSGAPSWTPADHAGMTSWCTEFLHWLQTSKNGTDEAAATNNHGSFFDEQEAALAGYTGQRDLARSIVRQAEQSRIDLQIAADGTQPLELVRTRSWHYSMFNLMALTRLAQIGRHVGVDVWHYRNANGATLFDAIDYLIPAATQGQGAWPYPELTFQSYYAIDVLHAAAHAGDRAAAQALRATPAPPVGDLWSVLPAAEDLG